MINSRINVFAALVAATFGGLLAGPVSAEQPTGPAAANVTGHAYAVRDGREPSPDQCALIDVHMQLPHGLWSSPGPEVQSMADEETRCLTAREQRLRLRSDRAHGIDRRS